MDNNNITFNSSEKQLISSYVQNNILSGLKAKSSDFLPMVEENIKKICVNCLKMIKTTARIKPPVHIRQIFTPVLDLACVSLIKKIMLEKFEILTLEEKFFKNRNFEPHAVLEETDGARAEYALTFGWTPSNSHIYSPSIIYTVNQFAETPQTKLKSFWEDALAGKNTDLTFQCQNQTFTVHSFFLKKIDYFKNMLNSGFKEAKEPQTIQIQDVSPKGFEQFLRYVYMGSLEDLASEDNTALLLDIFAIAHLYDEKRFQSHILELLHASLYRFQENINVKIGLIFNSAALYENKELTQIGFMFSEKIDNPSLMKALFSLNQEQLNYLKKMAEEFKAQRFIDLLQLIEVARSNLPIQN